MELIRSWDKNLPERRNMMATCLTQEKPVLPTRVVYNRFPRGENFCFRSLDLMIYIRKWVVSLSGGLIMFRYHGLTFSDYSEALHAAIPLIGITSAMRTMIELPEHYFREF